MRELTFGEAIEDALAQAMADDERVAVFALSKIKHSYQEGTWPDSRWKVSHSCGRSRPMRSRWRSSTASCCAAWEATMTG